MSKIPNEHASTGLIIFGFIWRAFVLLLAAGLIEKLLIYQIARIEWPITYPTSDELAAFTSQIHIYCFVLLILDIVLSFVCCWLATKWFCNDFSFGSDRLKDIKSCITLVLVLYAVYSIIYSINILTNLQESINHLNSSYITIKYGNPYSDVLDFIKSFSSISLFVHALTNLALIFMQRMWMDSNSK